MSTSINRSGVLWAVGILQPVSALELSAYLASVLPDGGTPPSGVELHRFLLDASDHHHVIRVSRDPDLFSLTRLGGLYLSRDQRLSRDRERIFLLHDSWAIKRAVSLGERVAGLDGEAPSNSLRTWIKGSGANKTGPCVPRVRSYWPRISRQLSDRTGPSGSPSDTSLEYLSFATQQHLRLAKAEDGDFWDFTGIGLALGISPRLLVHMVNRPERHYRSFDIIKASGGTRTIDAPRVFLKIVLRFIADYLLYELPVHIAVHSFIRGRSPVTNASQHVGARWVGTIDVKDFFPSITTDSVENLLIKNGFGFRSARSIARLCTHNGSIPQGSPCSPVISNAIMFDADNLISKIASDCGVTYSRYADDFTFSGLERNQVQLAIGECRHLLRKRFNFLLNEDKTRLNGPNSKHVVTGATVSHMVLPSRKIRRNIRAGAFNISKSSPVCADKIQHIEGYLSYFKSFPDFNDNLECERLEQYIERAKNNRRNSMNSD